MINFPSYPRRDYEVYASEITAAIDRVLTSGVYILGDETENFETEFARWLGVRHAIGTANGTSALELIMRGLDIGYGDLIAVPSHTAVATVAAIRHTGAKPIFIDIEPDFFTICPQSLEAALSRDNNKKIRAIIAVHLYGCAFDFEKINRLAQSYSLPIIEDACQAHGATYNGLQVGSLGSAAAFSFYPTKNLGCAGDGGAVTTNDPIIAERIRALRQYGWRERYCSDEEGTNSRLDELQAAILRIKLPHLHQMNRRRCQLAQLYDELLTQHDFILPRQRDANSRHVYHQYVVQTSNRDHFFSKLKTHHIPVAIHYPAAAHQQPAYKNRYSTAPHGLPNTEKIISKILSLPIHQHLPESNIRSIYDTISTIL